KRAKQCSLRGIDSTLRLAVFFLTAENVRSLSTGYDRPITGIVASKVVAIASDEIKLLISLSADDGIIHTSDTEIDSGFHGDWDTGIPRVKLSGDIYDGCGILDYDYSIGKYYLIKIDAIEKF